MSTSILAFALAQALDAQTTCLAIHHRNAYETNRLLPQSCMGIAAAKSGVAIGGSLAFWHLRKEKPGLAKWLAITATAATGAAIAYNFKTLRAGDSSRR
jgi:hypothetical protein